MLFPPKQYKNIPLLCILFNFFFNRININALKMIIAVRIDIIISFLYLSMTLEECLSERSSKWLVSSLWNAEAALIGDLMKRCSEKMQEIYRRIPMLECDFDKVAYLYWQKKFTFVLVIARYTAYMILLLRCFIINAFSGRRNSLKIQICFMNHRMDGARENKRRIKRAIQFNFVGRVQR